MPGEVIDRANPPPSDSQLPDSVLELSVKLEYLNLHHADLDSLWHFRMAANYIAAAMIFLKDNILLERDLTFDDIKPRLLGHWGTCPGLILVYAHLNFLIQKHDLDMIFVVGPGHGAPAILATLWLEGSLGKFYPKYASNREGLQALISGFSTPAGFPSHISAQVPGSIHEGGELGYALSVAFGAVMDKPDLVVCCVVGDGESETGPTATAWHAYKYIDPKESGAVIPILHVNGFKISERTIPGVMDEKELVSLYSGYGYCVRFVGDMKSIDTDMATSLEWALRTIRKIQKAARSGKPIMKPRWPMIILRTPKGWGCPQKVDNEFMEGSFNSHQVPLLKAKTDPGQLKQLQDWLHSYGPAKLFRANGSPCDEALQIIPCNDMKKLGQNPITYNHTETLAIPKWQDYSVPSGNLTGCMQPAGQFLDRLLIDNPSSARIFSPDELVSNKLDAVFLHTGRNFQWDIYSNNSGGRVIEMLSEHTLQGFLQGYTITGRTGLFPTYEAFLGIISTMVVQFSKFGKQASEVNWRKPVPSVNYLETATWTRQEHNGFSHQNPGFIGTVLNLKAAAARVYLPPDANTFLSTLAHCFHSKGYVNLIVGSKLPLQVYLNADEAERHCRAGASVWKFASTDEGLDPDVVIVGIGAEIMFEVVCAAALLAKMAPKLRVRVVNVTDLMILESGGAHPHSLTDEGFEAIFTADRPVHINYHGYPHDLRGLLFGRPNMSRVTIEGYAEEGSTTTPFDMMLRNRVSRYHVAEHAVRGGSLRNEKVRVMSNDLVSELREKIREVKEFIFANSKGKLFHLPPQKQSQLASFDDANSSSS
ncbi:hypothetical protein MMC25_007740 [Agyrium rufum]|nr:hypothetical protein [Agyrium rufum]